MNNKKPYNGTREASPEYGMCRDSIQVALAIGCEPARITRHISVSQKTNNVWYVLCKMRAIEIVP